MLILKIIILLLLSLIIIITTNINIVNASGGNRKHISLFCGYFNQNKNTALSDPDVIVTDVIQETSSSSYCDLYIKNANFFAIRFNNSISLRKLHIGPSVNLNSLRIFASFSYNPFDSPFFADATYDTRASLNSISLPHKVFTDPSQLAENENEIILDDINVCGDYYDER